MLKNEKRIKCKSRLGKEETDGTGRLDLEGGGGGGLG